MHEKAQRCVEEIKPPEAGRKNPIGNQNRSEECGERQNYLSRTKAVEEPSRPGSAKRRHKKLYGKAKRNRSTAHVKLLHHWPQKHAEGVNGDRHSPEKADRRRQHDPPAVKDPAKRIASFLRA
jgi:hypothetical protein